MLDELLDLLSRDVVLAAQRLLGCHLVMGDLRAAIVETEAYRERDDPASHAFRGPTPRNKVMYEEPGKAYVYFNYGVHWMLNVTAHPAGSASAILIRAAQPIEGLETMRQRRAKGDAVVPDRNLLSGPGKLCKAFGITSLENGLNLMDPLGRLRIEVVDGLRQFVAGPRIGIAVGKGHETPWRFVDRERSWWASGPRK